MKVHFAFVRQELPLANEHCHFIIVHLVLVSLSHILLQSLLKVFKPVMRMFMLFCSTEQSANWDVIQESAGGRQLID